jgi:Mg2+-importing ATPase
MEMMFLGFLVFFDPLREGIAQTIHELNILGIGLKVITGDNRLVATSICKQLVLLGDRILISRESDEALQE